MTGIGYEVRVYEDNTTVDNYTMRLGSSPDLVDTILWMIESLPTEMDKAHTRVGLRLALAYPPQSQ